MTSYPSTVFSSVLCMFKLTMSGSSVMPAPVLGWMQEYTRSPVKHINSAMHTPTSSFGFKRIVIASSAPPIRYPDCYGIDMSTLGELVAFRALVNLLGDGADDELRKTPLPELYARFDDSLHAAEIARLLTPPGMKAEVAVVYQTVEALHSCLASPNEDRFGDWYFTGDYPTPGGYKVLRRALANYLARSGERSY